MVIKAIKSRKAARPSEVCAEIISTSGEVGISVMMKLCQHVLDLKTMLDEWQTSVLVSIFKGKGDVRRCNAYGGVKLLEHTLKIIERVLKRRIQKLVNVDAILFLFANLSSIHEKANCIAIFWTGHLHSLGSCHFQGVWATCLPHKGGGVPLSTLPKDTTSKLTGLFSTTSSKCQASSREAVDTIF